MAVTGVADPRRLLQNVTGRAGLPLTLTKPLGIGVLNNRHKVTGEVFEQAVETMVLLNRDAAAVPYLEGARHSLADGFVPGGSRRNLDWVRPELTASVSDDELLLLADAQTSGGLLVAGELPGHPVDGEPVPRGEHTLVVR